MSITYEQKKSEKQHIYFVGIDQSITHTGISIIKKTSNGIELIDSFGISTIPKNTFEHRLNLILSKIKDVLSKLNKEDTAIAIEGLAFAPGKTNNRSMLYGLFAVIILEIFNREFNYSVVPPTTLKKVMTGNGKAKKDEMLNSLYDIEIIRLEEKSGLKRTSKKFEDIVDSYLLAKYKAFEYIEEN